jgi:hypothetical protein
MLALPPESADADRARGFEYRCHHGGAAHGLRLAIANRKQRTIGYRFDEAATERAGREAKRSDVVLEGHALHDVRMRGPRMDQRAAQGLEELIAVQASGAMFRDLAPPPVTTSGGTRGSSVR